MKQGNDDIRCFEVAHNSEDYRKTVELRFEILRRPLGLEFSAEQLEAEKTDYHLSCTKGEDVIACLILRPKNEEELQMRQVAVSGDWQGKGVGSLLVRFAEEFGSARGFSRITMHARETAVPFYLKLGYRQVGARFVEVTIPHFHMEKELSRP